MGGGGGQREKKIECRELFPGVQVATITLTESNSHCLQIPCWWKQKQKKLAIDYFKRSIFTLIIILSSLALNIISLPFFFIIGVSYSPPSDLPQYSAWQPFSIIIVIVLVSLTIIMIMVITQISGTINKRIICMKLFIPSCAREAGGAEGMYAVINSGNVTHSRRLICLSWTFQDKYKRLRNMLLQHF